jgi:hypothetical protein
MEAATAASLTAESFNTIIASASLNHLEAKAMKKQVRTAKLALHRETLVYLDLNASRLGKAAGGYTWPCSNTCASLCPCTD